MSDTLEFQPVPLASMTPPDAIQYLVDEAASSQASDLFLFSEESVLTVAVKRMGSVEKIAVTSKEQGRQLIGYIKAMAGLDIAERRRPLEGRWIVEREAGKIDLRVNVIPTLYGEDVTARILDRKVGLRTIENLGMSTPDQDKLISLLASPSGLLLVTGPTGTGKTTTLYACLQHLSSGIAKINTLEDPIEYALPGIRQSQVNAKLGVDFAELLRNILRQSPDVIMIGEVRDESTANTAVRAANSGHLVLATLHAPIAAGAIQSMRALGTNPYFLSSGLLGVVAQRLVRKLCTHCRSAYDIAESPATFAEIRDLLLPGQGQMIYGPTGCENCRGQGYAGRAGVFEIMSMNRRLRHLLQTNASVEEIQKAAIADGMIEFQRSSMVKVAQGITSMEEILREFSAEYLGIES
ncbi:type II secretion system protein E [Pirellula staleyi DSM 6068]|uniref:Type II secretion system protein E n=1 Tax=Pirellula staleyi (strain ATCC 27377 / DSM 6068 / ICPB 4128) TaxID=530564 RepID=D2QYH0_PIRSD|nr:GspE/PulE family protein [Pirellula staleyi]ADB18129.1 type II secretion system protein E [Pirellula staleyi DSM 6068]